MHFNTKRFGIYTDWKDGQKVCISLIRKIRLAGIIGASPICRPIKKHLNNNFGLTAVAVMLPLFLKLWQNNRKQSVKRGR